MSLARLGLCVLLSVAGCESSHSDAGIEVALDLPAHFPSPRAPAENPLRVASVELGRHLFYDTRLSSNGTIACASCHKQELAFADDVPVSPGATGAPGVLNAPSLANAIYASPLTWNHPTVTSIEEQLLGPMFGESPLEMGLSINAEEVTERLAEDPLYQQLFEEAYPNSDIDLDGARFALASFVRSLLSYQAPFDRYLDGEEAALTEQEKRGVDLFYSERLGCSQCHVGFNFSTAVHSQSSPTPGTSPYHNIGLYNLNANGDYPSAAQGLINETGLARDMGRFRVPSLRNVAVTAPYGHDGSVPTLEAFIKIYEAGGREITEGSNVGDGRDNPWRSDELQSFSLRDSERDDLIAFLHTLTDPSLLTAEQHANPW